MILLSCLSRILAATGHGGRWGASAVTYSTSNRQPAEPEPDNERDGRGTEIRGAAADCIGRSLWPPLGSSDGHTQQTTRFPIGHVRALFDGHRHCWPTRRSRWPRRRDPAHRQRHPRRGNEILKRELFLSAFVALSDPASRACYDLKIGKSKSNNQAVIALARRRCAVVCVMLRRDGTIYQSDYHSPPDKNLGAAACLRQAVAPALGSFQGSRLGSATNASRMSGRVSELDDVAAHKRVLCVQNGYGGPVENVKS